MNKKEELKRLLRELTKDELMEIIADSAKDESVHEIDTTKRKSRRGKGTRRKNKEKQSQKSKRSTKTYGNDKGDACRKGTVDTSGNRPNKFDDFMKNTTLTSSERSELEAASQDDKKNKDMERSPRTRTSNIIEVECRACGVLEDISASVVYDKKRWKCNKCSAKACD